MTKDITVIGAGVVGMATASYLLREGHKVTVVDQGAPGEYCSFGNAGILSPGSCVPFGMPGTLAKVPGYLLDAQGPLSIRPSYAPRALPWLLRFVAASSRARIDPIADALRALLKQTFDAWTPLVQWAGVPDLLRQSGYIVVYESERTFRGDALAWQLRRDRGVICEDLDAARIRELEPALRGIYSHGVFLPEQGYVANPFRLTQSLAAQFQRDGGTLLRRRVLDLEMGGHGPQALLTDSGRQPVETLVICAGVHSNAFSAKLGSDVPLESQRGYHVHYEQPTINLRRPVMSGEGKFFATPMEHGLRVAGAVEFAGTAPPANPARTAALKAQAQHMLPELAGSAVTDWMGHRPCMPDSLPVIGPSPRFGNTYFAFGHGHVGLCGGAPTGRLIAELIAGRPTNIDIAPYRADRF